MSSEKWSILLIVSIYILVPSILKLKKYVERDNLKLKVWLLTLPIIGALVFVLLTGGKNLDSLSFVDFFYWIGLTLLMWLPLAAVIFWGISFGRHTPPWEVSPTESEDNASELFDMALKIAKDKREGKDTSKQETKYKAQLKNFEETGDTKHPERW